MRTPHRRSLRRLFPVLCAATAFGAGVAGHALLGREARAQSSSATSTVYVPADGIVFRSLDGRPIARLSRDVHGGTLELYDDHEQPVTRLVASPFGSRVGALECAPPSRGYVLDDGDPWSARQ